MSPMTENEIKAADIVLKMATVGGIKANAVRIKCKESGLTEKDMQHAVLYLKSKGFISIGNRKNIPDDFYMLEDKGLDFQKEKRSFSDYLEEEKQSQTKQLKDAERDSKIKDYQLKDLDTKVNKMNDKQMDFWDDQKRKNRVQIKIAKIAITISIISLLQSLGLFRAIFNILFNFIF